ncbi:MAG TPA: ATP-binding cassette domain-containing protein [Gemmatimonadota bacterium]|nr:ATP-binding cassette domain-containing protein [Gemmatimonadota bacterium]
MRHVEDETPPGSPVAFHGAGYAVPDGRWLVRDLSFSVGARETVVLVGRSGAGKTTALKLVNRLLDPSAGTVVVGGVSTDRWNPVDLRRRTGWVIQETGLFPHMTVRRNVGLVPELLGWAPERIASRVDELLDMVGLPASEYADRRPHQLSGGQRQRVGVARALAADPPLLLLDEPFGALDPITRAELQREFRGLVRGLGKAALFVTHDLREALVVGDRVGVMEGGRMVALEPAERLLASDHPAARALAATLDPAPASGMDREGPRDE